MKRFILLAIFMAYFFLPVSAFSDVYAEVGVFYDSLAPYGDWIYLDTYGVWVFRPAGLWPGWQPYTYGRWEWSEEYGWIWVSYFEWGWAPFHYGRWFYDEYYGWVWVPGTIWRPHWVVWIQCGPYIGWYPYYPSFIYIDYYSPVVYERWIVIESSQIDSGRYQHNAIPMDKRAQIFGDTSGVHKYIPREDDSSFKNYGPPKSEVEKYSNKKIEPIRTEFINKPLNVYRPKERRFEIYKPEFKTQIGDIGRLKDSGFNKGIMPSQQPQKNLPAFKSNISNAPRYNYPLGSFNTPDKDYHYNKFGPQINHFHKNSNSLYNYKGGSTNYNDNSYSGDRIMREESVKSYSPTQNKGLFLPKSSSDDDDDDNAFKKSVPKFSPRTTTVPKSVPQLKGK